MEGWGADVYIIDDVAIVTGYAPFGNIEPSYELCMSFDEKAKEFCYSTELSVKDKVEQLLSEFLSEVVKDVNK